ncbi:hypothetical protein HID58_061316, partial [Brassica napus]
MATHKQFYEGVPSTCRCGKRVVIFFAKTDENSYKRFYRCEIGLHRKQENHLLSGSMKFCLMRFEGPEKSLKKTVDEEVRKQKNSL